MEVLELCSIETEVEAKLESDDDDGDDNDTEEADDGIVTVDVA